MNYDELAKICYNLINAQGLSREANIQVGAKIITLLCGNEPAGLEEVSTPDNTTVEETPKKTAEPPKEPAPEPRLIAPAGEECACIHCNAVAYKRVKDVYDPMKMTEFLKAFTPVGHKSKLNSKTSIQNIDGNIGVDCPFCGGDKSVFIVGPWIVTGKHL